MKSENVNYIIFDTSWTSAYDQYLQRFDGDYEKNKASMIVDSSIQPKEISHDLMFNTVYHAAKIKRPIMGIYKRPI
jgi:hypothetical protein